MTIVLKYGERGVVHLDVPDERLLLDGSIPRASERVEPFEATTAALASPLEYPPLAKAIVPGDRIAIAVSNGVPYAAAVVGAIVRTLIDGGASAEDVVLLLAPGATSADESKRLVPDEYRGELKVVIHDPRDSRSLCYLAASKDGKPIYFNRKIFDADLVIPVGVMRSHDALGYNGVHNGLFPGFSDEATLARFRIPASSDWSLRGRRQREEIEEAAWLLGVQFTVQTIPGPCGSVLQVLAGEASAVANAGRAPSESAWRYTAPRRASIVIAALGGGREQQTWESFGRALFVASNCVADGGAVVLCTSLSCQVGPALRQLSGFEGNQERLQKAIRRERSEDAVSASLLAQLMQRAKVYLLSELDAEEVENLGVAHVEQAGDVERLCLRHESCIVLGNAQHATIAVLDD